MKTFPEPAEKPRFEVDSSHSFRLTQRLPEPPKKSTPCATWGQLAYFAVCWLLYGGNNVSLCCMKFRSIIIGLIATLGVAGMSCEGKNQALTVKSFDLERRVEVGNTHVSVDIAGEYPQTGNPKLVNAVRVWLAELLAHAKQGEQPLFATPPELLGNARMLIKRCSNALIRTSEEELKDYASGEMAMPHEFEISFAPTFNSERLLTYVFTEYIYLGGAHGVTLHRGQTFAAESGEMLTNRNVFLPNKLPDLLALMRNALWEQYFKKEFPDGTLAEALLIDPANLELPSCNPQFGAEGITFTYQQYEIAPYSAGHPSCTIPYSDLRSLMRPEIIPLLPQ